MWVLPDTAEIQPGYEQLDINGALAGGGLVPIASGQGHEGAITIHQRDAVLWGARLSAGESVEIPAGGHVHTFVALGAGAATAVGELATGDAVRTTNGTPGTLTATVDGTELLVWVTA